MARCDRVRPTLADYAEGCLKGRSRARVEAHLRDCADCRTEMAALERTGEALAATGTVSAPSRIWEVLRAEIGRAEAQPTVRGLWRLWRGAVAAAALAMVVIAVWAVRPQEPLLPPPTVVAAEVDQEFQSTLEGHLSAIWVTPLADEAALGLQMAALGEEG